MSFVRFGSAHDPLWIDAARVAAVYNNDGVTILVLDGGQHLAVYDESVSRAVDRIREAREAVSL